MISNLCFSYSRFSSSHALLQRKTLRLFPTRNSPAIPIVNCSHVVVILVDQCSVLVILDNIELINRVCSLQEKRRMRIAPLAIHKVKMSAR